MEKPHKKRDFAPFGWCKRCSRNRQWLYFCGCRQLGVVLYCRECYNKIHETDLDAIVQKQMGIKSVKVTPWQINRRDTIFPKGPTRRP